MHPKDGRYQTDPKLKVDQVRPRFSIARMTLVVQLEPARFH